MGIVTGVTDGVLKLTDNNKNARLAIASFVISALVIAFAILIVSFSYDDKGFHFSIPNQLSIAFVVAFLIMFIASWFILYLLNAKDNEDIYTEVRKNLRGDWTVTYSANKGPLSGAEVVPTRTTPCTIDVNQEQKLIMIYRIHMNPIFVDDEGQVIRDVAVRYNEEGGYTLLYYYKAERGLPASIVSSLIPSETDTSVIEVEIFGHLKFSKPDDQDKVRHIEGHWYDLNGNVSRLFALLDLKTAAAYRKEQFQPMKLSQVPIHQTNFDADMGVVTFTRGAEAKPSPY
jgi:hypothetical protein